MATPDFVKTCCSASSYFFSKKKVFFLGFILALVSLAVFFPALENGFVTYDDPAYVTHNEMVKKGLSLDGARWAFMEPHESNWHPLTWLSHMADCQLFGLSARGHHLSSLLIHALNSVLVFLVLHRLTGTTWRSFAVALFFSVHPLRVESVAWISERKDVLSGMFFLLALYSYGGCVKKLDRGKGRTGFIPWHSRGYLAVGFFLCLGLLSKPMLVTTPFVLLLLDYWPLGRLSFPATGRWVVIRNLFFEKIPFFVLTAAFCVITYLSQRGGGATTVIGNLDLFSRLENVAVSYCRYIGKLFWPFDLSPLYPFPPDWWPPSIVILATGFLTVATAGILILSRKHGFFGTGWLMFMGMLVPVIGLVQVGEQSMADRYSYLPHLGLWIIVVWSSGLLFQNSRWRGPVLISSAILFFTGFVVLTRTQITYWKNGVLLFAHAKEISPPYSSICLNLGIALGEKKRYSEAIAQYEEALRLQPNGALIYYNLAEALEELGRNEEALAAYRQAFILAPALKLARLSTARMLVKFGSFQEAVLQYEEILRFEPENLPARLYLGCVLAAQKNDRKAIATFQEIIRRDAGYVAAHRELANVWASVGNFGEAQKEWSNVLALHPGDANANNQLAILLAGNGQLDLALQYFREAVRIDPGNEDYAYNLNAALAEKKKQGR